MFLNVPKKQVGKIGGGRNKPTGVIDVAIMQSLSKNHEVDDVVANYGLGLSATLTRKDGHHPIVFMQCGLIRYQVLMLCKMNERRKAGYRSLGYKMIES